MKQQDLMKLSPDERIQYIEDRWAFMLQQISQVQQTNWQYTGPSSMPDCNLMLDVGSMMRVFTNADHPDRKRYFFFGKVSSDTGMPQHGELHDNVRRTYFVGRFWAGEKPERTVRSPHSPMPSSRMVFMDFQSSPPPVSRRSQYECPAESPSMARTAALDEYCSCECCKRTFSHHKTPTILKRHGYGQLAFEDGRIYDGHFHNDQYHGVGTFYWPNGQCYQGEYKYGHKHGRGKFTHSNGAYHVGQYFQSQRHGYGVAYAPQNGGVWYCGFYEHDLRQGHGLVVYEICVDVDGADNGSADGISKNTPKNTSTHHPRVRWRQGQWEKNRPWGWFRGALSDFTPIEEYYNDAGEKIEERVMVMEDLRHQLNVGFQDFCDVEVVCCGDGLGMKNVVGSSESCGTAANATGDGVQNKSASGILVHQLAAMYI